MLEIHGLHATIDGKEILKGLDLILPAGEVHAIMGPNGAGKSTLSYLLSGREGYTATSGEILFKGQNLLDMDTHERAQAGVFLAFQYPVEIPGVANSIFLKAAVNAQRQARGETPLDAMEFLKRARVSLKALDMDDSFLTRPINVGFSGGEKKRNEIFQMQMLAPALAILDETDSGLDIDALKLVARGVNDMRDAGRGMLVITHYQRLLDEIIPDYVHVMGAGRILRTGGSELALELEKSGYDWVDQQLAAEGGA
ncbi:MAG: Fe-S cluster assembly ATPase SufC [Rhodospirillales bacterium]|nr:Fe-S cluster assembly ATPase SufC [Rhodospirillales bacterium]